MALTMLDKQAEKKEKSQWSAVIAAELELESQNEPVRRLDVAL